MPRRKCNHIALGDDRTKCSICGADIPIPAPAVTASIPARGHTAGQALKRNG